MRKAFCLAVLLAAGSPGMAQDSDAYVVELADAFSVALPCSAKELRTFPFDGISCQEGDVAFAVLEQAGAAAFLGLSDDRDHILPKFDRMVDEALSENSAMPPRMFEIAGLRVIDATGREGDGYMRLRIVELDDGDLVLLAGFGPVSALRGSSAKAFFDSFARPVRP